MSMSNLAQERRYAYKDYIKWDDNIRYELINGVPYAMAAPSRLHQKVSKKIFRQLDNFLIGKTCYVLKGCDINLSDVFYDIESESDENESAIKQRIIEAMKESGVYTEQIEKIMNSI